MNPSDEARKSALFDAWIADLRADRPPRVIEHASLLPPAEVSEVLSLARWWVANVEPSAANEKVFDAEDLSGRLRMRLEDAVDARVALAAAAIESASNIGEALNTVVSRRRINLSAFERAAGLRPGVWDDVTGGTLPFHRLPYTTGGMLLRALGMTTPTALELTRKSCREWAESAYASPAASLGRIDPSQDRRATLEAITNDEQSLVGEMERIDQFIASLRAELAQD